MIENKTTEFQREFTENVARTVVAFANTEGGRIYIGVSGGGIVHGVRNMQETMLQITNMIRDSIRPDITAFAECTVETMEGRLVVVLSVQRGTARPYYLTGKGVRPEGVYLRLGTSSVPASEAAILNMIRETSGDRWEEARSIEQELSFGEARRYFSKRSISFGEQQKRQLRLIGEDGTYTNLGVLLSDQCAHTIKLAVFEGTQKSVFRDRREMTGSLLVQLEEAYSYIDQFNHTRIEYKGLARADRPDYPGDALREALLNAVAHRDYGFGGPTMVSIFDDRIEFVNPGSLMGGMTLDDLGMGMSELRNPNLAGIFHELRLIEPYGAGIQKINEGYADSAVKPRFEISDNGFKAILPNINYTSGVRNRSAAAPTRAVARADRSQMLLQLAEKQGTIIRKDVEAELRVSQPTAVLILREMVEKGLLIREGSGKQQKYRSAAQ